MYKWKESSTAIALHNTSSYHHLRDDLIEVYKILHGLYDKEDASFIKL